MKDIPRGADMLASAIRQAGISKIFSLSGNHIMPMYDAILTKQLDLVHTRHEGASVHMADAWARLTGKVGVALVTGGPGHANAVSALYTAYMSESPVVLMSGHAPLGQSGWGAFQEIDQVAMAKPVVKAAWAANSADTLAEDFAKACRIALSGRPGPVHLSLPVDVLESMATNSDLPDENAYKAKVHALSHEAAKALVQALQQTSRPIVLVGPQGLTDAGRSAVAKLEASLGIPVIATESPRGSNDPSLGAFAPLLATADCVLLVGKRLDFTLGFGRAPVFSDSCIFLQVDADIREFDRSKRSVKHSQQATHQADTPSALAALTQAAASKPNSDHADWHAQVREAVAYRPASWSAPILADAQGVHPAQLCQSIQTLLDMHSDAVLVIDGGEFGQWAQSCLSAPHRIINGAAGAIGAALPMAIAAKLVYPNAPVVALMGDGSFGFHCAEFDTALLYHTPFICVVGNDARWNAEYQIQLRSYGAERLIGCELLPTRYERVAEAFGGYGEHVEHADAMTLAVERANSANLPACINVSLKGLPAPIIRRS